MSARSTWKDSKKDFKMKIEKLLRSFRDAQSQNYESEEIIECLADIEDQRIFVQAGLVILRISKVFLNFYAIIPTRLHI